MHVCTTGIVAPPPLPAARARTAPMAGSTVEQLGAAARRGDAADAVRAPARSQGTARKMPPARMKVNGWPTRSSRRATDSAKDSSSSAAPRRMPMATASPSLKGRHCTHCASVAIAVGLQVAVVDLVHQVLRAPPCRNGSAAARVSSGRLAAAIGLTQDGAQRRAPDPVAAPLVAEHVSPSAGTRRLALRRCVRRQSSRCRK